MNNPNAPARQGLQQRDALIKVEDFARLTHLTDDTREKYKAGVAKLREAIDSYPADSPQHQQALKKLMDVSMKIRQSMQAARQDGQAAAHAAQAAVAQQIGARPMSSGQQESRPQTQTTQGPSQSRGQGGYSDKVVGEVKKLGIVPPPQVAAKGQEGAKKWVLDAQNKYAQHLSILENHAIRKHAIEQTYRRRNEGGNSLSATEMENYSVEISRIDQTQRETRDFLARFQLSQKDFKNQMQNNYVGNVSSNSTQATNLSGQYNGTNTGIGTQPQIKQEPQGQPHTVSSAVDAARNQANTGARSAMSPQNNGPPGQPLLISNPITRPQSHNPMTNSHPPLNVNTNSRPTEQQNSPRTAPTQVSSISQDPVPLSRQAAVEQARSYSHPNVNQTTPQSATHSHPQDQRNQNNHAKMPIPKEMNLQPTQPVSMGPSRPTLSNGPVAMGAIGQPAIQRHPGFVLEGEGEHVLSKKKLEELVRQVTGGTGGEGEEGEALTAEVEEVCFTYLPRKRLTD